LLSGTIHKDNASTLPIGLIGIYEEALPPASNVNDRTKFLEFFTVWALLKKEVSVTFLIPLFEAWSEETIIYYINWRRAGDIFLNFISIHPYTFPADA
jgi:hypothetical protein